MGDTNFKNGGIIMLKNIKIDLKAFVEVIDSCENNVYVVTADGNTLNMKSKLSQLIGLFGLIQDGEIQISSLSFDSLEDESKVFRFLLYGEIKR